jgi:L-malate glycosyltransferase
MPMTKPISVLHVSSPMSWRGGEQQLYYLYSNLKIRKLNQKVFCPKGSILASKVDANDRITYQKRSGFDVLAAKKLKTVCDQHEVRLIHAHDAHAHTTAVLAADIWGSTVPIVLSRRVDFPTKNSFFTKHKYNHQNIKTILCVSDAIKEILTPSITAAHIRLVTVHSGTDINRFGQTKPGKLRAELAIPEEAFLVGNVAALADHKDYPTFLKTIKILYDNPKLWFVVIGSGPLENEIKQHAIDLELGERLIFAGFRQDLDEVFCDLDLLLFTSKTEGLGTTVLDAFANKIPVVATDAGGIPEMVKDGITGLLCSVGSADCLATAVSSLSNSETRQKELATQAYDVLSDFSAESMALKSLNEYKMLLDI